MLHCRSRIRCDDGLFCFTKVCTVESMYAACMSHTALQLNVVGFGVGRLCGRPNDVASMSALVQLPRASHRQYSLSSTPRLGLQGFFALRDDFPQQPFLGESDLVGGAG